MGWGVVWGVVWPPHCKGSIIVGWTLGSTRPILSFSFRDPPHLLPVASQISLASASQYRHLYGKLHVVIALSDCMFVKNERTNVASYLKVGGSGGSHG